MGGLKRGELRKPCLLWVVHMYGFGRDDGDEVGGKYEGGIA